MCLRFVLVRCGKMAVTGFWGKNCHSQLPRGEHGAREQLKEQGESMDGSPDGYSGKGH